MQAILKIMTNVSVVQDRFMESSLIANLCDKRKRVSIHAWPAFQDSQGRWQLAIGWWANQEP